MSYDYDYLIIDWDEDTFYIIVGGNQYEYRISEHGDLLRGGLENGVDYEEISQKGLEDSDEDLEDYGDYEDKEKEAERFNFLRDWDEYRQW